MVKGPGGGISVKRFDIILLFSFFLISSTVLFQNCSEMKGVTGQSNNENTSGATNNLPPPPEFLTNQTLTFDNKIVANQLLETIWSVGSTDIFYYETDYKAVYASTLITITGQNSIPVLSVKADSCEKSKNLTDDESRTLSAFFSTYINTTEIRERSAADVPVIPGCAFPRLALDATGLLPDTSSDPGGPAVDFDIYFTTPECTPDNEFFVSDRNSNDPAAALADVEAFFNAQIDVLCP